jgi:hypothetical protein
MVNLLSIFFFTIFTTLSAHCMEPITKETTIKKTSLERMFKRKSSSSLSHKPVIEKPLLHNTQLENPFIVATNNAIESKDYATVKSYLTNPHTDPNTQNQVGYPAIYIFAKAKAYDGINILLSDPRTDTSKRDIKAKLVTDYIDREDTNLRELRHRLFARFTLDMVTNQFCEKIKFFYANALVTKKHFTEIIRKIKEKIEQDAIKQNQNQNDQNSTLSKLASFPEYATDEFMTKKIWFILSSL